MAAALRCPRMPARVAMLMPSIATGMMIAIIKSAARISTSVKARGLAGRIMPRLIRAGDGANFIPQPVCRGTDLQRSTVLRQSYHDPGDAYFIDEPIRRKAD